MTTVNAGAPLLDAGVLAAIERHAFSDTSREVGGMLLGTFPEGNAVAHVQAALPALAAVGGAANITFTHAVWADILSAVDRDFPELRIVGWYHTHPGHGVFLSGYDTFIHESFFADRRMTALVIDPQIGELGWFGWDGDAVAETSLEKTTTPPATTTVAQGRTRSSSTRSRSTAVLGALALLLVGASSGYVLGGGGGAAAPARTPTVAAADAGALASAKASIGDLTAKLGSANQALAAAKARPQPADGSSAVVTYRVRRGDTLWGIALSMYGDGRDYPRLTTTNGHRVASEIAIGQIVLVPQK